jgi:hypothetical protein
MLNDEIISALARFFDQRRGPSHDEVTRLVRRAGLEHTDPLRSSDNVGKMKRVREVLSQALDSSPAAGAELVKSLILTIKAAGGFRPSSDSYAGGETVHALREALCSAGYDLDPEGTLRPRVLEGLEGSELTDALLAYVRRARMGAVDAALLVGTGKDLLEATARHVLVEKTGAYPTGNTFPSHSLPSL